MAFVNDNIYRFFRVIDPDNNGQNTDADSMPTAVLRRNGTTVGAATVTVTKVNTGYYGVVTVLDESHGWDIGDTWSLEVSYEVSSAPHLRCIGGGIIYERPTYAGTGARTVITTVTDGTNPLEDANVRYTKGAESKVVKTNASGQCTHYLDDGDWTVVITLFGYSFPGDVLRVDGDETPTYILTREYEVCSSVVNQHIGVGK